VPWFARFRRRVVRTSSLPMAAARMGSKRSPATRGLCHRRKEGYGRACALWVDAAQFAITVIVFMAGDGADRGDLIGEITASARRHK
jgi:hypothetical protein